ncbi:hypothetical protein NU688_33050 [Variovorax sp. ZS18.2.2]|uniref:hypothetical protein n=1 Tax=Variovorax sp. ZS18.2.2 TaxID=2971255 RepID=UPI00215149F1|nr:hypothetical protein [Variovorax sp. ZS18.2.2]MCR6481026.1 hypothetical protein [Variovorax sp. ZS18.2.2]
MAKMRESLGLQSQSIQEGADAASATLAWQRFVLKHGKGVRNRDLAAVLGRSVSEIEATKRALVGSGRQVARKRKNAFEELYELWHGRPPMDDEWPAPAFNHGMQSYEWMSPEVALLATLVGQMGAKEIAQVLSVRLQKITGNAAATRNPMAVQNQIARMGLTSSDVLGGITVAAAGREMGSYNIVHQAIRSGLLKARRVGRHLVISHQAWSAWKAKIQAPPKGCVQLSTLKAPLGIASDKLSEFARMGYVPGALQVKPYGVKNLHTTQFGSWYVPKEMAERLLADRRSGRPMPWHGKPLLDNLKATFRLWKERQHPRACATCAQIWGAAGAPRDFEDYIARYPTLDQGAKRHLTMVWSPGLKIAETALKAERSVPFVRRAIANGMLATSMMGGVAYIARSDATRWIARGCPSGDSEKSWISIDTAVKQYLFSRDELDAFCDREVLKSKVGTDGAMRGVRYVSRHQCAQLREKLGFSEEQAAARAMVTVPQLQELLKGVNWRGAAGIPLSTLQAVIKRIQSRQGHTFDEAAEALGTTAEWITECVNNGTVTAKRNKWDDRLYLSAPMLGRLRKALLLPAPRARLSADWVRQTEAAGVAGVSSSTLIHWAEAGDIHRIKETSGWHYHLDEVRARARMHWSTVRLKRAKAPAWLRAEQQVEASAPDDDVRPHTRPPANPWSASDRVSLGPLISLRQHARQARGLACDSPRQIAALFANDFIRIKDMEFVAFEDLDELGLRELSRLATAFAGILVEVRGPNQSRSDGTTETLLLEHGGLQ